MMVKNIFTLEFRPYPYEITLNDYYYMLLNQLNIVYFAEKRFKQLNIISNHIEQVDTIMIIIIKIKLGYILGHI